jgi:hypothetical protein
MIQPVVVDIKNKGKNCQEIELERMWRPEKTGFFLSAYKNRKYITIPRGGTSCYSRKTI